MKISVITVNYNNLLGLKRTMKSVLVQTFHELEYIIIDGGSIDGSKEYIEKFASRVDYWVSERDQGIYDAMNKGLKHATGEYCLFLNSGDFLCDKNVLYNVFSHDMSEDLIIGRQKYYNSKGRKSTAWSIRAEDINERFFWSNTLPHQSTFIKTRLLHEVGGYNLKYRVCADWVFWYIAIQEYKCSYRIIPDSISLMEDGGVSRDMTKCRKEMSDFLMQHHPFLTKQDWIDISVKYGESLCYRRSVSSILSALLTKLAIRINKK